MKIIKECLWCGKEVVTTEYRYRNGKGRFCSRVCAAKKQFTGRVVPDSVRKKISESHKGMKHTEETKAKVGAYWRGRKRKPRTLEHRINNGKNRRGANSHFWRGGVNNLNNTIRNRVEYKLWRESVFKRDNYTCVWCKAKSTKGKRVVLNADHIKPFAYYPELRFEIDNGRTLCAICHRKTETYGNNGLNKKKEVVM